MLRVDVLIDLFFKEEKLPARVAEIANCGYNYIETWKGGDASELKAIANAGNDCGVKLVSIVMNFAFEADVAPINANNKKAFLERIDEYSDNALAAGCEQGIVTTGQSLGGKNYQEQRRALVAALRDAGQLAARKGFKLNLEILNSEVDHSGYFLDSAADGVAIIKEVGLENVKVLYDIYHMGIMGGNLTVFIENNIKWIGHFHSAGIPGRHELFNGEINYSFIAKKIEQAGYCGYFGLEYKPLLKSTDTLIETLQLFK